MTTIEDIPDIDERFKKLKEDEGWELPEDQLEFDEMFPDYDKDEGRTIEGIFLEIANRNRKKDGKPIKFFIIITEKRKIIAVRDFALVEKGLTNVKKGDGVRITYLGLENKKTGEGSYRNFKVGLKKFEADPKPTKTPAEETSLMADNDDPEAQATIELFDDILNSDFKTKDLKGEKRAEKIVELAQKDEDLDEYAVARIQKQLAVNLKKQS